MRKNFQFYQWVILLWLGVGAQFTFASTIPEYNPACLVPPNECGPIAKFTSNVSSGSAPLSVQLNAGSSYDPDGWIFSYMWTINTAQGQIDSLSGVLPSYIFRDAGSYTVKLTVADNSGNTGVVEKTIEVAPNNLSTNCNQVTEIPVSECQSLLELYNSTNGANWKNNTGWNKTNEICSWYGVTCVSCSCVYSPCPCGLTKIDLQSNNLKGTLPNLKLSNLQTHNLSSNQLTGSIPDFNNLPRLIELDLTMNELTGTIPSFSKLSSLQTLYLSYNQLTGNIPNFSLPKLKNMQLSKNQLTGNIPNFDNLPNLQELWLYSNKLSGSIPNFSKLPSLMHLVLYGNQLSGNIPDFSLPKLVDLRFHENQLSGNIPNFSSFNLANLKSAQFNNNCGLTAYDAAQESILNQKDPNWKTLNSNCPKYTVTLNKSGNGSGTVSGGGTFAISTTTYFSGLGASTTNTIVNW